MKLVKGDNLTKHGVVEINMTRDLMLTLLIVNDGCSQV